MGQESGRGGRPTRSTVPGGGRGAGASGPERALTFAERDKIRQARILAREASNPVEQAWRTATEPIWKDPARWGNEAADALTPDSMMKTDHPMAQVGRGALRFGGGLVSEMTAPLSGAGGLGSWLSGTKKALPPIMRQIGTWGARTSGALQEAEGLYELEEGFRTGDQSRIGGAALNVGLGAFDLFQKPHAPTVSSNVTPPPAANVPAPGPRPGGGGVPTQQNLFHPRSPGPVINTPSQVPLPPTTPNVGGPRIDIPPSGPLAPVTAPPTTPNLGEVLSPFDQKIEDAVNTLAKNGLSPKQIAKQFGKSEEEINRIIKKRFPGHEGGGKGKKKGGKKAAGPVPGDKKMTNDVVADIQAETLAKKQGTPPVASELPGATQVPPVDPPLAREQMQQLPDDALIQLATKGDRTANQVLLERIQQRRSSPPLPTIQPAGPPTPPSPPTPPGPMFPPPGQGFTPEAQKAAAIELAKEGMPTTKEGMNRTLEAQRQAPEPLIPGSRVQTIVKEGERPEVFEVVGPSADPNFTKVRIPGREAPSLVRTDSLKPAPNPQIDLTPKPGEGPPELSGGGPPDTADELNEYGEHVGVDYYRLPDGKVVAVHASAAKGAPEIDYELAGTPGGLDENGVPFWGKRGPMVKATLIPKGEFAPGSGMVNDAEVPPVKTWQDLADNQGLDLTPKEGEMEAVYVQQRPGEDLRLNRSHERVGLQGPNRAEVVDDIDPFAPPGSPGGRPLPGTASVPGEMDPEELWNDFLDNPQNYGEDPGILPSRSASRREKSEALARYKARRDATPAPPEVGPIQGRAPMERGPEVIPPGPERMRRWQEEQGIDDVSDEGLVNDEGTANDWYTPPETPRNEVPLDSSPNSRNRSMWQNLLHDPRPIGAESRKKDPVARAFKAYNQVRMPFLLSGLAPLKSLVGNIGSHAITAPLEALARGEGTAKAGKFYKELFNLPAHGKEFKKAWQNPPDPRLQEDLGKYNFIGRGMSAADEAAKKSLLRAGITGGEKEAGDLLLSNPNPVSSWPELKSELAEYLMPFKRIPFNSFAQGVSRYQKYPGIALGASGAGLAAGSMTDDPEKLSVASAALGPYSVPFIGGVAASDLLKGRSPGRTAARALQGISPIPEWAITKAFTPEGAYGWLTEPPGRRWLGLGRKPGEPREESGVNPLSPGSRRVRRPTFGGE